MSNWRAEIKRMEAARKREEREAKKRQRELERQLKEEAKLSEVEQARLEVEQFENDIDVLLSVHKEQSSSVDWVQFVASLPPHPPLKLAENEFGALLYAQLARTPESHAAAANLRASAVAKDRTEIAAAKAEFDEENKEWQATRSLAMGVLAGDLDAYDEAFRRFSGFGEVSGLGKSFELKFHTSRVAECSLTVRGQEIIPTEAKSLTAAKKLSVKAMPKNRFHEIYQDHVCGCVLRVARELFALLPLDTILITAKVDGRNGRDITVLSVVFPRREFEKLDFLRLDPSNTVEQFLHRGDAKASRKSGEFAAITPLTISDISSRTAQNRDLQSLLADVRQIRVEFAATRRVESETEPSEPGQPSEVIL